MTRLAVPTSGQGGMDAEVGEHFGRVPTYTLVDLDTEHVKVIANTSQHAGGAGLPAELLAQLGVNGVLCRGLGRRAVDLLTSRGIDVRIGATGVVRDAIEAWKEGRLPQASEASACQQHAFRDRGHESCGR